MPFTVDYCKNFHHTCPNCGAEFGKRDFAQVNIFDKEDRNR